MLDIYLVSDNNNCMDDSYYENLKRRAEEQYRQTLAAIERVRVLDQANGEVVSEGTTPVSPAARIGPLPKYRPSVRKGRVVQDVRSVVGSISGVFDSSNVIERLAVEKPGIQVKLGTLKAILKRMSETGEIEVVTQGIGRRATQYRRT